MSFDNDFVNREMARLLCHDVLGSGSGRTVYSSKLLPDHVIKVEEGSRSFQNVLEWETWERVRGTEYAKWFAPCHAISPCGAVLIMERTRPPTPEEFPELLPVYLTDTKRTNYGVLRSINPKTKKATNRFVCHDYGFTLLMENGMTKRMKKVDWWDL